MFKRKHKGNLVDGTTWEFARPGWWAVHLLGAALLVWIGMELAADD